MDTDRSDITPNPALKRVLDADTSERRALLSRFVDGAKPRFETVMKVAPALGVEFTAQPA